LHTASEPINSSEADERGQRLLSELCLLTFSDFAAAKELGVRNNIEESAGKKVSYGMLAEFAQLAAEDKFAILIARTFSPE